MKITIELSKAQVQGIKAYLIAVGSIVDPTKKDIQVEINGIIQTYLQAPQSSLTDYIQQYEH